MQGSAGVSAVPEALRRRGDDAGEGETSSLEPLQPISGIRIFNCFARRSSARPQPAERRLFGAQVGFLTGLRESIAAEMLEELDFDAVIEAVDGGDEATD